MKDLTKCVFQLAQREIYDEEGVLFFTDCGNQMFLPTNEEEYKFCPYCGKPIEIIETPEEEPTMTTEKNSIEITAFSQVLFNIEGKNEDKATLKDLQEFLKIYKRLSPQKREQISQDLVKIQQSDIPCEDKVEKYKQIVKQEFGEEYDIYFIVDPDGEMFTGPGISIRKKGAINA